MKRVFNAKQRLTAGLGAIASRILGDKPMASDLFKASFTGQWEGGNWSRKRNRPPKRTASQDTDLNYGVREDLLSEARSLEQTYPITKRIKNQYASYCVGRCRIRWNTGDLAMDKIYRAGWDAWMKVCDYKAQHQFPKLMKLAVSQGFAEGDMFVQKIRPTGGQSMIDLIEADRVSSQGIFNADLYDSDGPTMIGGIKLDSSTGRAVSIRVWQRTIYGTFLNMVEIPKNDYLHYFDSARVDAKRGVTGFHAVLNALRDLKEIDDAQRLKTKKNSKLAIVMKMLAGPQAAAINMLQGDGSETDTNNGQTNTITTQPISDAADMYLFPGESATIHEGNDPGEAWENHMHFIIRNIALGCNLPFGIVWDMAGLPKPGVLVELNQAERTIVEVQEQIEARLIIPIAGWWLSGEIANKRLPFSPNWYQFSVARPSYISIDAGRDSAAAINERKMGMKTLARWYAETEDDWIDELDQCIAERKYLESACKLAGIDPNNVVMMNNNPAGAAQQSDAPVTGKGLGD